MSPLATVILRTGKDSKQEMFPSPDGSGKWFVRNFVPRSSMEKSEMQMQEYSCSPPPPKMVKWNEIAYRLTSPRPPSAQLHNKFSDTIKE